MSGYPYEIWNTRKLLGTFRDAEVEPFHWLPYFPYEFTSEEEYIDFEKLPKLSRKMAAFTLPLGRGNSVYDDSSTLSRFKPAYAKTEDRVDPLMPLIKRAGIDPSMIETVKLTPMQRRDLIILAMTQAHFAAHKRRHNWMAAKAVIDGKVTVQGMPGSAYPTTLVDFQRAAGHTQTLGAGSRYGDSGVSIVKHINTVLDTMMSASFGGLPTTITMGSSVASAMVEDTEIQKHMNLLTKGANIVVEQGLVSSGVRGDLRYKLGSMFVGGGTGTTIDLWVDNNVYIDPISGASTRYIAATDMVFTGSGEDLSGFQCFGRIIDPDANYEPIPIFPKQWRDREGDIWVDYVNAKSSPLMVPIAPNTTFKATVTAS